MSDYPKQLINSLIHDKEAIQRVIDAVIPNGNESRGHYYAGTYAVHLRTGKWIDYDTGQSGNDITSLYQLFKQNEDINQVLIDPLTQAVTEYAKGKRTMIVKQLPPVFRDNRVSSIMQSLGYVYTTLNTGSEICKGWQHKYNPSHIKQSVAA